MVPETESQRTSQNGILLRFRDLVTEPGGNIAEHRRIIDEIGFTWWGWWARSQEIVPTTELASLLEEANDFPVILFDSGLMKFYYARCSKIAVSPSDAGIASPDFRATPHYYVRGSYPAWFRLNGHLELTSRDVFSVTGRPTILDSSSHIDDALEVDMVGLRDERPTLWLIRYTEGL